MLSCRLLPRTQMNVFDCMIWVVGLLLLIATVEAQSPQASQAEEIYIARSVAESQNAPTGFCAPDKTGFGDAMAEYRFSFRSVSTNTCGIQTSSQSAVSMGVSDEPRIRWSLTASQKCISDSRRS